MPSLKLCYTLYAYKSKPIFIFIHASLFPAVKAQIQYVAYIQPR